MITPGVSCPEVPAENWQQDTLTVNGTEIIDTDTAMTALFNMFSRCPVLSVPAGMTDKGLPVGMLTRMGLATLVAPKTSDWSKASAAIQEYIDEQEEKHEQALSLAQLVETAKQDVAA